MRRIGAMVCMGAVGTDYDRRGKGGVGNVSSQYGVTRAEWSMVAPVLRCGTEWGRSNRDTPILIRRTTFFC